MSAWKERAVAQIQARRKELLALSRKIQANPELAYEEFQAASWLSQFLEAQGFSVKKKAGGLPTAFVATLRGKAQGPTVAFLAEYDALPGVGHGCGHNLIGTGAVGAASGVATVMRELEGTVQVIGTPAEEFTEGKAGKIRLVQEGVFSDVDVCLMFHPWTETAVALKDFGFIILNVAFYGKPAHAAADPWNGSNALDAVVLSYDGISTLRQQMKPEARVHCIITDGGDAVNVIPRLASARVMFRAPDDLYLEVLRGKIEDCARGGALATGTDVEIEKVTHIHPSLFNPTLYEVTRRNVAALGESLGEVDFWAASSDFGNVSQVVPAQYVLVKTHQPSVNWHSKAVAEDAISEQAHDGMLLAARFMAMSAIDLLAKPDLLRRVKKDFEETRRIDACGGLT